MKMIKHLGKIRDSDSRVLVVFMSLPNDDDNALVVYLDGLNDHVRDELADLIALPEAQNEKDLGVFLQRKTLKALSNNVSALTWLHTSNKLVKVLTKNVIMTPNPSVRMPLNELNKTMKNLEPEAAAEAAKAPVVEPNKKDITHWGKTSEDKKKIAENLQFEARLLREDANAEAERKEAMAKEIERKFLVTNGWKVKVPVFVVLGTRML